MLIFEVDAFGTFVNELFVNVFFFSFSIKNFLKYFLNKYPKASVNKIHI